MFYNVHHESSMPTGQVCPDGKSARSDRGLLYCTADRGRSQEASAYGINGERSGKGQERKEGFVMKQQHMYIVVVLAAVLRKTIMLHNTIPSACLSIALILCLATPLYAQPPYIPEEVQWQAYLPIADDSDFSYDTPTYSDMLQPFLPLAPPAIAADKNGNVYVSAGIHEYFADYEANVPGRVLVKYTPDGTPVFGPLYYGSGAPWFMDYYDPAYFSHPSLHALAIDENNGKIYVLFSLASLYANLARPHIFFFSCHDIHTGIEYYRKLLGHGEFPRGGLDIDSNGDVWTVFQRSRSKLVAQKWSGATGDSLAFPGGSFMISTPDTEVRYIGFGIRKTDDKMYIAHSQEPQGTALPDEHLVVSLYSSNSELIGREEHYFEIPMPSDAYYPPDYFPEPVDETILPSFSEACVDGDGNFAVGGLAEYNAMPPYSPSSSYASVIPVILKFKFNSESEEIEEIFRYVSPRGYPSVMTVSTFDPLIWGGERYDPQARIAVGPDNMTLYRSVFAEQFPMLLINNSGHKIDQVCLERWLEEWTEYPPGTVDPCSAAILDFTYAPDPVGDRIVVIGAVYFGPTGDHAHGLLVSSHRGRLLDIDPPHTEVYPQPWDWHRMEEIAMRVREIWPFILTPQVPGPSPGPPVARAQPQRYGKPRYSFSVDWRSGKMPSYLSRIYAELLFFISNSEHLEFPERSAKHIAELLQEAPAGLRFTQSMQHNVTKSISEFKGSAEETVEVSGMLLEALNAIDLDWRVPAMPRKIIRSGKDGTAGFRGVAWISFKDVERAGECSLRVEGGLPALAKGFEPGWPVASYGFDFKGTLAGDVDITFYIGGMRFRGQYPSPHVLQWDGKSYKDVTTTVDWRRKVVTARTNSLSTFVIMNAAPEKQRKEREKAWKPKK